MVKYIDVDKAFTHGGTFHADDVFSGAFLKLLNPDIRIERGFTVPENFEGIVFDIGDGEFDHHAIPKETRDNGIEYAAFGKLWRKYSHLIVSNFVSESIDTELICNLDLNDNTGKPELLSKVIGNFNPFWYEDTTNTNKQYLKAVKYAKGILLRFIHKYEGVEQALKYVQECYEKSDNMNLLILDKYVPWKNAITGYPIKVVMYPSNRGGWCAERIEHTGFEFPLNWRGKRDKNIAEGFIFCHATGFLVHFESKETLYNAINPLL